MIARVMICIEDSDLTSPDLWSDFVNWALALEIPSIRVYQARCINDEYEITAWLIIPGQLVYRAFGIVKEPESASVANRLDSAGFKAITDIQGV